MKLNNLLSSVCALGFALALVSVRAEDKKEEKKTAEVKEVAVIKTDAGEMVLELWSDVAPKTVENFKKLSKEGFYDGTCFHRIMKDFMIQGGDPLTKDLKVSEDRYGSGGPGYTIQDEFNDRPHVRGVISMAHTPARNSGGCQFFICHGDCRRLDRQYAAFGKVIKGDDVLETIANTPVVRKGGEASKPTKRINVQSIKIVPADSVK